MNKQEEKEIEYTNEVMNVLCNVANNVLNSGNINSIEGKQKMYAIASFLEFIKAGFNELMEMNIQLVILGTGDPYYEGYLKDMEVKRKSTGDKNVRAK